MSKEFRCVPLQRVITVERQRIIIYGSQRATESNLDKKFAHWEKGDWHYGVFCFFFSQHFTCDDFFN